MNIEPSHQLQCRFSTQTGSIERLLRVIRVRGFTVRDLQLDIQEHSYQASIAVAGRRSIDNLISQLAKLVEVTQIEQAQHWPQEADEPALEKCA